MSRQIRTRAALIASIAASTLVAGACRDESTPAGPGGPPPAPALQRAPEQQQHSANDPQLAYARAIPGFGGVFLDRSGTPTVYLKDVKERPAAERALAGELQALGISPARLRVVKGDFDYLQLDGWFNEVAPQALAVPGAVFMDVDEATNRLRIGVESPTSDAAVRAVAARLNVPSTAVAVQVTEPMHLAATLGSSVSPKRGGLQIAMPGVGTCSLGFNTWPAGLIVPKTFVTASHCTAVQGALDGTSFYQPTVASANLIGTEISDPPFFTTLPCPSGRRCRFSDAARVKYVTGPGVDLGGIARTTGMFSTTIDPANPVFNITAEKSSPLYLSLVQKIGRTTGWTRALVLNTCTALNVANTNITLLCQDLAGSPPSVVVGPGDSGAPVFTWSGSGSNVTLVGILWGSNSSGTQFAFSRMSGIEAELGSLRTF